ncbi:hypothetical protein [Altererythrobacter aquiaggeris]|uniref:hypothetical protein n=1 Tax=Aestuarierythrobacter aquiaggeris TaxID=1898396 RepID=UPI00301A5832
MLFVSASAIPAAAQDTGPASPAGATAEEALADARAAYGPADDRARCPETNGQEIVVCIEPQDDSDFRVESSGDLDPDGAGSDDGLPRAPDVFGIPDIGGVTIAGCFLPPCPPPPAYIIDFDTIPEPPEGSDADRISRGEIRAD